MSGENKMISYTNEQSKEIHQYARLKAAYQDYQLTELIKALPDDMILEIKAYVISPYKYMAELKLYKCPTFINTWAGEPPREPGVTHTPIYRVTDLYGITNYETFNRYFKQPELRVQKLQRERYHGFLYTKYCNVRSNPLLYDLYTITFNTQAENRQLLRNYNIKGRTKLNKLNASLIIEEVIKQS